MREILPETLTLQLCNLDLVSLALGQVILHQEGHMDDGLTLQRCQHEESQAARIIRNTTALFSQFVRQVSSFPFSARQFLFCGHPILPTTPFQYYEFSGNKCAPAKSFARKNLGLKLISQQVSSFQLHSWPNRCPSRISCSGWCHKHPRSSREN